MGLSSNSLIHFTNNITNLVGILQDNFKIKYCYESIESKNGLYLLIPMVSFCDIPFSQIINHAKKYGNYGIGLKKEWAEKNGLNPVLYIEKNSTLGENFFDKLKELNKGTVTKISELSDDQKHIFDIFRYLKNYQGDLKRNGKQEIKNYRFSDEREWRFTIPIKSEALMFGNVQKVNGDLIKIKKMKEDLNSTIINERLIFEPEDISYIIINKESERDKIIRTLETIKGKFPLEQVKRLTSRIISTEQIATDF